MISATTPPCPACDQVDIGQRGTAPCTVCGLPTEWAEPAAVESAGDAVAG